ncbi:poly [ADP-ribose] polymerase 2-like [Watersipora subatra]|uniref:poly [ADP-ribose] polymerase 2-like n=1 Tax=Watersipora subatra TaxID=2589382 RepID=UPI00355B4E47
MNSPERVVSLEILQAKMDLLEAFGDIEIAVSVLKMGDSNIHPVNRKYLSLEFDLEPMDKSCDIYKFCKVVYFADCSSKSAIYCFPTKRKTFGLLLRNEVMLGQQNEIVSLDYCADKLPKGKHSVNACGKMTPNPKGNTDLDGVTVPCGKPKKTDTFNSSGYTLYNNEYIVYNTNQIKMKYLLKVKFNFRH